MKIEINKPIPLFEDPTINKIVMPALSCKVEDNKKGIFTIYHPGGEFNISYPKFHEWENDGIIEIVDKDIGMTPEQIHAIHDYLMKSFPYAEDVLDEFDIERMSQKFTIRTKSQVSTIYIRRVCYETRNTSAMISTLETANVINLLKKNPQSIIEVSCSGIKGEKVDIKIEP